MVGIFFELQIQMQILIKFDFFSFMYRTFGIITEKYLFIVQLNYFLLYFLLF